MARFDRLTVLNEMLRSGLVPVFYNADLEVAKEVLTAVAGGGSRILEFTNRGDRAWQVFSDLAAWAAEAHPEMILGVGSVIDMPTAALYVNSGANFVVGPVLNAEIGRLCNRRHIAYSPGCGSASEISEAEELGVEIVKVFPGSQVGGPKFVKSVLGPMPWVRIMPTGGVDATAESVNGWIQAGAACLGMGSRLIRKEWVAAEQYGRVRDNVEHVLKLIQKARRG